MGFMSKGERPSSSSTQTSLTLGSFVRCWNDARPQKRPLLFPKAARTSSLRYEVHTHTSSINDATLNFKVEKSSKPVVAAIQGACLGGGLEVAMACHYRFVGDLVKVCLILPPTRIAVDGMKTSMGLPEVMLGVLPGGGGTQRLPKLTGLPNSLDMALTGKTLNAKKAKKVGLVDAVVDALGPGPGTSPAETTHKHLEAIAMKVAKQLGDGSMKLPNRGPKNFQAKAMDKAFGLGPVKDYVFKTARGKVMKQTNGLYPAPLKILDSIRAGLDGGPTKGYEAERTKFGELVATSESRGLISLFHGQTECKKNKFGAPAKPSNTLGILGAGLMGAGIAQVGIMIRAELILVNRKYLNPSKCLIRSVDITNLCSGLL